MLWGIYKIYNFAKSTIQISFKMNLNVNFMTQFQVINIMVKK